jgi:hypothetical protein
MATEALNVIAATQLANRIDFVFIISWGFYLIIPQNRQKLPSLFTKKGERDFGAAGRG